MPTTSFWNLGQLSLVSLIKQFIPERDEYIVLTLMYNNGLADLKDYLKLNFLFKETYIWNWIQQQLQNVWSECFSYKQSL